MHLSHANTQLFFPHRVSSSPIQGGENDLLIESSKALVNIKILPVLTLSVWHDNCPHWLIDVASMLCRCSQTHTLICFPC